VLGWCAATLTSVALAWVAMLPVLRTATPDESALISVDQLRDSGTAGSIPVLSPPPGPPPSSRPPASPATGPATTRPTREPAEPSPSRTSSRPARAPATAAATVDGWTVMTDGDGATSYLRSFRVEGGQTVIRMTEGRVRLVTATPSDGFSVETVQNTPDNLAVYFNEVNHGFIIHAVWWDDRPFAEVSEIGQG
jgi:hypothetical protein